MRSMPFALCALLWASPSLAQPQALPPDKPVMVGGIEVVCTGVGLDARQDARWSAYPLKVEIAGAGGRYLGDIAFQLKKDGATMVSASCDGPWMLFRVAPGRYQVQASIDGHSVASSAIVPAAGQGRIILRFTDDQAALTYPMNYADEAARTLGVKDGKLDVFATAGGGAMPAISGRIDGKGPALRLRWPLNK